MHYAKKLNTLAIAIRRKRSRGPARIIKEDQHRINRKIRAEEVRLVGENVEVGVYKTRQAQEMAEEQELDLVEISPNASPPVCKIMDYKKFVYEQKKREKVMKSKATKLITRRPLHLKILR